MIETQQSICTWADATFGVPVSDASIAARALVEMAELVTACVDGEPAERIGAEIADVVIVLARLGRSLGTDVILMLELPHLRPKSRRNATWHAMNACGHLASVVTYASDESGAWPRGNLGWLIGALAVLARDLGIDLSAAIDAKMTVNRARRWVLDGNGHGRHVTEPKETL